VLLSIVSNLVWTKNLVPLSDRHSATTFDVDGRWPVFFALQDCKYGPDQTSVHQITCKKSGDCIAGTDADCSSITSYRSIRGLLLSISGEDKS